MGHIILIAVFLLSCQMQGSRAVTPVFVQKGNYLLLDVMRADVPEDFLLLIWEFNKNRLVTLATGKEPTVSPVYRGKVEFSEKSYSVKLKNLQETDSGVYTARVTGVLEEQTVAEYNVTVQAPVSPVELTVDSVFSGSDSCNLTVTCRTQDSHISSTFRCVNQTCSEDGGERTKATTSGAFLQVYFVNGSIKCNHSNQVSWTTNQGPSKIQDFCPRQLDVVLNGATIAGIVTGAVAGCLLFVLFIFLIKCIRKKIKEKKQTNENTVYDVPQEINPAHTQNQNPVTSTYAMVQFHKGPEESTNTKNTSLPETIYAQVNRAEKSNSRSPPSTST